jgi:ABC-type transporter Mla subunit MlaD
LADTALSMDVTVDRLNGAIDHLDQTLGDLDASLARLNTTLDHLLSLVQGVDQTRTDLGALTEQFQRLGDAIEPVVAPAARVNEAVQALLRAVGRGQEARNPTDR